MKKILLILFLSLLFSGCTVKNKMLGYASDTGINALTEKTSLSDNDNFVIGDASENIAKRITESNLLTQINSSASSSQWNKLFKASTTLPYLASSVTCSTLSGCVPSAIVLGSLSSTFTGLTYTNTTGVFSATAGYQIPLSAKLTKYDGVVTASSTYQTNTLSSGNFWVGSAGNIASSSTYTTKSLTFISYASSSASGAFSLTNGYGGWHLVGTTTNCTLGVAPASETWTSVTCQALGYNRNRDSVLIKFGNALGYSLNLSVNSGTSTLSMSQAFASGKNRCIQIGTASGTVSSLQCTITEKIPIRY